MKPKPSFWFKKLKFAASEIKKKPICLLIIYIYPIKFSRKQTFIEHVIGFSIQSKVYNGFPTNEPMANSICQKYTIHCINKIDIPIRF